MRCCWLILVLAVCTAPRGPAAAQDPTQSAAEAAQEITNNVPREPAHEPPTNSAPVRPVATRQAAFSIPFSIAQAVASGNAPIEVQLLVSSDRGKSWSLYLRQRPDAKKFNFRAEADGEYWFASRTLDAQGRTWPEGETQPELKVAVDRQNPKFELTANATPSGEIQVAWNIFDPNLAPESLRLDYRGASDSSWSGIGLAPTRDGDSRTTLVGQQSFSPRAASLVIDVRGEVRDEAGNVAVANKRVFLPREARRAEERPADGLFSGLAGLAKLPFREEGSATAPPDPFAQRRPAPFDAEPAGSGSIPHLPDTPAKEAGPSQPWLPGSAPAAEPARVASAPAPPAAPPFSRFASNSAEPFSPQFEPPPGEKPSFSAARQFNLDYDTDSVGPSGVAAVELWGTSDGGRTWTKWGLDEDKRTPVRVDVEEDGLYGFRVVVESGAGLAGPRPHSGDAADIWVTVDTKQPAAQLTSAIFGAGEFVGQLEIRWEASDENLTSRPITLAFAAEPEGPWTTIAAGLENSGRYLWNADPRLPRQIYLRIEARDEAGNVGSQILADPLSTEGLAPKGKIRGLRPVEDGGPGAALRPSQRQAR